MSANAFVAAMDKRQLGENGAAELTAKGVGNALVALFFELVRSLSDASLATLTKAALAEASDASAYADLIVLAFQTRATRGMGKGEKALFYKLLALLDEKAMLATLHLVPHFGYWKDFLLIQEVPSISAAIKSKALELMSEQLKSDSAELEAAEKEKRMPKLSLCAKYAPREGSHFDKKGLGLAKKLSKALFGEANEAASKRKYRKLVSSLNTALNTTEVLMAANRYEEIEFSRVSSLCLQRYRKAFLNESLKAPVPVNMQETGNRHPHDEGRVAARKALRAAIGKKVVNGKQLFPHEIVEKCTSHNKALSTLERELMHAQWETVRESTRKAMEEAAAEREQAVRQSLGEGSGLADLASLKATLPKPIDLGKLVALVDVSGSMHGTPMMVAIALGILVAELSAPAFRDRVLTFESKPNWVDLSGFASIEEKAKALQRAPWGGSTNFEAACEKILHVVETEKLKPDDVPDLIVFSDMQFNDAGVARKTTWETHYERLVRRFEEVGKRVRGEPYPAPRIIFWNLRGAMGFPVDAHAPNTQMLSGFSPSLMKLLLSGKDLIGDEKEVTMPDGKVKVVREGPTPEETVRKALDDSAFDSVRLALTGVKEGPLAAYSFATEGFEMVDIEMD
ncbi:hypothetical protein AB1Y20_013997 [Prymnesium parvum]|uniref:Uncharacterized protein n=1 Tax=Prymnesium parvum TaxID=97485 RepID=A0AB34IFS9_PRYPA